MTNPIELALINFEAYDGNSNRLLGLATIDLPEIELTTTDILGAGIAGEVSWPVKGNFANLATTIHWRTLTADGAQFLNQNRGHMLSLRGAQEVYDAGSGERKVVAVRVDMRTHATKLSMGKFEPGEQVETELELMIDALTLTLDGKQVVELDKFNYKYSVNGEDNLRDVQAALGL